MCKDTLHKPVDNKMKSSNNPVHVGLETNKVHQQLAAILEAGVWEVDSCWICPKTGTHGLHPKDLGRERLPFVSKKSNDFLFSRPPT
ncbi:unnamed protein product [Lactuca virosa]|uniref:Uncharacterized protein n=1 Tax=Lactuca virosa TaxID=75947 RepID=A0AAU9P6U0_9ASTR|nr:unnamed protein product [Lactuca virosa]